jgi:hypothetical protein
LLLLLTRLDSLLGDTHSDGVVAAPEAARSKTAEHQSAVCWRWFASGGELGTIMACGVQQQQQQQPDSCIPTSAADSITTPVTAFKVL